MKSVNQMKPLLLAACLSGCGAWETLSWPQPDAFEAPRYLMEFQRMLGDWWAFADQDRDDRLSLSEAQRGQMKEDRFRRYDQDGSGQLDLAEMQATFAEFVGVIEFSSARSLKLDRNGDERLAMSELQPPKFVVTPTPWCPDPSPSIQTEAFEWADRDQDARLNQQEVADFLVYLMARSYHLKIVTPLDG